MSARAFFDDLVAAQKRGEPRGMTSVCSAHPFVLRAALRQAAADGLPALIESTVNQVNQFGGYTGMRPADFRGFVAAAAAAAGFPPQRLILGADHLGPYPWRREPAQEAMARACALARECVGAGYRKLHLDASMPLGGDPVDAAGGISPALIAQREAQMAEAAEAAWCEAPPGSAAAARSGRPRRPGDSGGEGGSAGEAPMYVIGTDVPPPGGMQQEEALHVTTVEELLRTVDGCREAFSRRGLDAAWARVFAVVVQPGVEYGDHTIHAYDSERARPLCAAARRLAGMVLEGHSTDHQSRGRLRRLVKDGVAILKVGPALTFAMREALFALEWIEGELAAPPAAAGRSRLAEELERAMLDSPAHWQGYYTAGNEVERRLARRFSLSDRSRYYWSAPPVAAAVQRLLANLGDRRIPETLVSQYFPHLLGEVRRGRLEPSAGTLVERSVRRVLEDYSWAVGAPRFAAAAAAACSPDGGGSGARGR